MRAGRIGPQTRLERTNALSTPVAPQPMSGTGGTGLPRLPLCAVLEPRVTLRSDSHGRDRCPPPPRARYEPWEPDAAGSYAPVTPRTVTLLRTLAGCLPVPRECGTARPLARAARWAQLGSPERRVLGSVKQG